MNSKPLYQSKTFWFNIIMMLLDIVATLQTSPLFADKVTLITIFGLVHTMGNIVLRYVTDTPINRI